MKFQISVGRQADLTHSDLKTLYDSDGLHVRGSADVAAFNLGGGRTAFIAGEVIGLRATDGNLLPTAALGEILRATSLERCQETLEGRYLLAIVSPDGSLELCADRFGQRDCFYAVSNDVVVFASDVSLLPASPSAQGYDQVGLAHALAMYGYRPAKRHTIYNGVRRLGVGEIARVRQGQAEFTQARFDPAAVGHYGERELNEYADTLLDAVRVRGSRYGNVVYLSSGWDSTSILACLVHVFGARKVRAVIGRMQYANRSGVINQFELDRAQAVADFFGIQLDIAELDYRQTAPDWLHRVGPLFKSNAVGSFTGINHAVLADKAARTSKGDEVVFAGEISDGAHNLGFAQFATILEHPVHAFREYSDKMASYLFGPTFLRLMQQGRFANDPIYQLLRGRTGAAFYDEPAAGNSIAQQILSSFFLSSGRLPFWSLRNSKFFTAQGAETYRAEMEATYLKEAASAVTPETLYAWYLRLYNSFHWQGSTVATLPLTAEAEGLHPALPFWDSRLQEFLSGMPEDWGRGLDLNPTKYPLKWTLKNRVKYPMHLQVGPHSYLYDVDPSFSHSAELMYGSSFAPHFADLLARRDYRDLLSSDMFDMPYVDSLVDQYLARTEVRGSELSDLTALATLSMSGWY